VISERYEPIYSSDMIRPSVLFIFRAKSKMIFGWGIDPSQHLYLSRIIKHKNSSLSKSASRIRTSNRMLEPSETLCALYCARKINFKCDLDYLRYKIMLSSQKFSSLLSRINVSE
jgi:hypothetical protein